MRRQHGIVARRGTVAHPGVPLRRGPGHGGPVLGAMDAGQDATPAQAAGGAGRAPAPGVRHAPVLDTDTG